MQFTMTTDYAIRVICCLAENKGMISSTDLSTQLDIPMNYIFKVMKILKQADMVQARDGLKGGYILAKQADEITLLDIAKATEKTTSIMPTLGKQGRDTSEHTVYYNMESFYKDLQKIFDEKMAITISDLILVSERRNDIGDSQKNFKNQR